MTHRTVTLSSFENYSKFSGDTQDDVDASKLERDSITISFPYAVMLEISYPEIDFANRWCWQNFGPMDGVCNQKHSDYPVCNLRTDHAHKGTWTTIWFVKTDYDFGFNEWYFSSKDDYKKFVMFVPEINWGEKYIK